jgi:hypothetical protein
MPKYPISTLFTKPPDLNIAFFWDRAAQNTARGIHHCSMFYISFARPASLYCEQYVFIYIYIYVYILLVGKPEGKRPLGRSRRRWEDNITMDLQEVGGGRGDWMELAQDRDRWRALVGTVRDFLVP